MQAMGVFRRCVAVTAVFLAAACGQSNEAANALGDTPGNVLRAGNAAEPGTLDPARMGAEWEDRILGDLFLGLVTEAADGSSVPGAAERWDVSPDGLTWTFHLRDQAWSDGMPLTAEDFVYSWRRLLDPATAAGSAYLFYAVKNAEMVSTGKLPPAELGVSAPNPKTFVVELARPVPYFVELATYTSAYPVPRHVIEANGDQWTRPGNMVGNGAYVITEWIPNDHITVSKNPRFYDAANVKIDQVIFYPLDNYEAALQRFRAGELDTQVRFPATQIDWVRQNMPEVINLNPVLTVEYFSLNQGRKPFDDIRVREAINLALDRESLLTKISRVGHPPAYSLVPPGIANYPGGPAMTLKNLTFPERLTRAQQLMKEAGFGPEKPLKTTMSIRSAAPDARRVPAAMQEMWRAAYIDAEIVQMDAAVFFDKVQQHDFDIGIVGWVGDYNDPTTFLDLLRSNGPNNYGQYSNVEFDRLLDQASMENDLTKRGALLAQAETILLKDFAVVPSFFGVSTHMIRPYVKGWIPNANGKHRTRWLSLERPQ